MRLLGLDYGSKTVGVAGTDPLGYTAQPLETITEKRRINCGVRLRALNSW